MLGLAVTACLSFAQNAELTGWKSFTSSTGFSVKYPGSWVRKGNSKDRLMVLSSKGGAEAIVIKNGQAMISVIEEKSDVNSSLSQLIDRYNQDVDVLSRRNIRGENAGSRGCRDLNETISKEPAVPPEDVPGPVPYLINTEYFCEVKGHIYAMVLRNFEGDPKQALYQQIALQVAKSLRVDN
jgi:hypothetical protein